MAHCVLCEKLFLPMKFHTILAVFSSFIGISIGGEFDHGLEERFSADEFLEIFEVTTYTKIEYDLLIKLVNSRLKDCAQPRLEELRDEVVELSEAQEPQHFPGPFSGRGVDLLLVLIDAEIARRISSSDDGDRDFRNSISPQFAPESDSP